MSESSPAHGLSIHRSDALTDGVFAVAMTLLVIDLKLPEHSLIHTADDLAQALASLLPKAISWFISFGVLAFFWFGHQRAFNQVRSADGKLVALNIGQLAFVSVMPFSAALVGEHGRALLSQIVYSLNMVALATMAWLTLRYIYRHPEISRVAPLAASYRGARFRLFGLMLLSVAAVALQYVVPTLGNIAFTLMMVIMPISRRIERSVGDSSMATAAATAAPAPAPAPAPLKAPAA